MQKLLAFTVDQSIQADSFGSLPDGVYGSRTANGERVNCSAMTAAHRILPFGTQIKVCHHGCVVVRINDRGPFVPGRHIDLTPAAARPRRTGALDGRPSGLRRQPVQML